MLIITTPKDVLDFGGANLTIDENQLCSLIPIEEEAFFNTDKCLGWDYYVFLLSDLLLPTLSPVFFEYNTLYFVGDIVNFNDRVYECVVDTTGEQDPQNSGNFKPIKKFISPASNEIWDRYIAKFIAWSVLISAGDISAVSQTAQGMTRTEGDNFRPATPGEIEQRKRMFLSRRFDLANNMKSFLERNKDLYPQTLFYKSQCPTNNCNDFGKPITNGTSFFDRVPLF